MRQNRFYLEGKFEGDILELTDLPIINQIKNVLRLKEGDFFSLFNGSGVELKVKIKSIRSRAVEVSIVGREKREESSPEVCLYLAILKKENFELAVQKAVEAGVTQIIPIITERTIKLGLKIGRLKIIIKEASEQSGRFFIPSLKEAITFSEAISQADCSDCLSIFCDFQEKNKNIDAKAKKKINIFVGPEGGWSTNEQELAQLKGLLPYSLGEYVLRAETAAIVTTWLAVNKKL
jgi:16S rRNA (uracil1498-N3)-methyltransferase